MKKVLVLFGGNSPEHLISCRSARAILENIDSSKYLVDAVGITKDNDWYFFSGEGSYLKDENWLEVSKSRPILNPVFFLSQYDIVFPIIHGTYGEDGKLQGFLDFFDIPYVGSKTLASALGMDKALLKELLSFYSIPQVPFIRYQKEDRISDLMEQIDSSFGYPVIVKPSNGGSSIGIRKVNSKEDLEEAITLALSFDSTIVLEKFLPVRELECGILEHRGIHVSKVGEILSANEFYDYEAKYENEESKVLIPADIPISIKHKIQDIAKKVFKVLHAKGYARLDFFYVPGEDQIYFNEINTIPGFNSISMYPMLFENEGISFTELLSILIENAKEN